MEELLFSHGGTIVHKNILAEIKIGSVIYQIILKAAQDLGHSPREVRCSDLEGDTSSSKRDDRSPASRDENRSHDVTGTSKSSRSSQEISNADRSIPDGVEPERSITKDQVGSCGQEYQVEINSGGGQYGPETSINTDRSILDGLDSERIITNDQVGSSRQEYQVEINSGDGEHGPEISINEDCVRYCGQESPKVGITIRESRVTCNGMEDSTGHVRSKRTIIVSSKYNETYNYVDGNYTWTSWRVSKKHINQLIQLVRSHIELDTQTTFLLCKGNFTEICDCHLIKNNGEVSENYVRVAAYLYSSVWKEHFPKTHRFMLDPFVASQAIQGIYDNFISYTKHMEGVRFTKIFVVRSKLINSLQNR